MPGRVIKKLLKNNYFFSKEYAFYLKNYIEAINQGKLKTWDLQISYVTAKNNKFFIFPKSNLVNNIGFNKDGTSPFILSYYQPTEKIFPLIHPQKFIYNSIYDVIYFDNLLKGGWLRLWLIKIYLDLPESLKKLVQKFLALLFTFRKYV